MLSLKELFDRNVMENFDHDESQWAYDFLKAELEKGSDDHAAGQAIIAAFTEKFGQAPAAPVI